MLRSSSHTARSTSLHSCQIGVPSCLKGANRGTSRHNGRATEPISATFSTSGRPTSAAVTASAAKRKCACRSSIRRSSSAICCRVSLGMILTFAAAPGWFDGSLAHRILAQDEQIAQFGGRQHRQPVLAGAHQCAGKILLALDHIVDLLLHGSGAEKLVHLHLAGLPDTEGTVRRLILDGGVPPAVEVEDVVGGGQIEPCAACLQRQQEQPRTDRT